jgi:hypothetical protein
MAGSACHDELLGLTANLIDAGFDPEIAGLK